MIYTSFEFGGKRKCTKKTLINLSSVTLAFSIFFGTALTSFAAEETASGYPEMAETWLNDGSSIVYNGDVTTDSANLSSAYAGSGSSVTVNGDVENVNESWRSVGAFTGGEVTINGDVSSPSLGSCCSEDSTVIINGDVNSGKNGILTQGDNSSTTVNGDINAKTTAITAKNGSTTEVNGDVTGDTAINTETGTEIYVDGDISYGTTAIKINDTKESTIYNGTNTENGTIVVTGTVSSYTDSSNAAITVNLSGDSAEEITSKIPTILVYELPEDTEIVSVNIDDEEISNAVSNYVMENINYIIKEDEATSSYYTISGYTEISDLMTMTINSAITVATKEGYTITGGDNVIVTDNGNNTYTVTLISSAGAVNITAKLINGNAIVNTTPVAQATPVSTSTSSGESSNQEAEEAAVPFIFATFSITGTTNANESVLAADSLSSEDEVFGLVTRPVVKVAEGNLTAIQYKNTFIQSVTNAPANAIVRLETSRVSCFDTKMIEALAKRPDVTLEVVFPVNGENIQVTVPAGYDVMSLLDENGYCGFLYLNSIFNK